MLQLVYAGNKYANKLQTCDADVDVILDAMQNENGGYQKGSEFAECVAQASANELAKRSVDNKNIH